MCGQQHMPYVCPAVPFSARHGWTHIWHVLLSTHMCPPSMCEHCYKIAPALYDGRPHTASIAATPDHTTSLVMVMQHLCIQSCEHTGAVCGVHVMWLICMQPSHRMSLYSHMYTCGALNVQCGCTMCTSTRHELQCMHRIRRS